MFHTEKHELTNDQITKLNNYIDLIVLPKKTYDILTDDGKNIRYSSITNLPFSSIFTNSSTTGNPKKQIKDAYISLQQKLNEYADSNNMGTIINNVLLKNGFVLHDLQDCYIQNIFSLLIFLYNNHNNLYENTFIKKVDSELYNRINRSKQNITKLSNYKETSNLQNYLKFDKDNGITFKDFYPLTKCDLLIKELNIKPLLINDYPEKDLNQISNNSRYYIDKIIKLITNLNYTNFIIYTYKFSIIIYKLYFLNYSNIPQFDHLKDEFRNDGDDESLIRFAKKYCSALKYIHVLEYETKEINKDEFVSKMGIDTSSNYYFTTSELEKNNSGFHQIEWNNINRLFEYLEYDTLQIQSKTVPTLLDKQSAKLKSIFITIVRDIFNFPFETCNRSLIDNLDSVKSLTDGIYINSQLNGHYNNFIKCNEHYIMFDDIYYRPTETMDEHDGILYKNIQIENLDGKLYINSVISNNRISTPFVIETNDLLQDLDILFGKSVFIYSERDLKQGFNSFNFDTTAISKIHGSNKFSMLEIIVIATLIIIFIVLIIIVIVKIVRKKKYNKTK